MYKNTCNIDSLSSMLKKKEAARLNLPPLHPPPPKNKHCFMDLLTLKRAITPSKEIVGFHAINEP